MSEKQNCIKKIKCLQLENQTYATKTGDDLQLASNLNIQICLSSFPIGAKVDCILFANKTSVYYKFCIYFTIAGLHKTLCHTFTKSNSSFIICARAFLAIYVHIFLSWNKFAKMQNRNLYSCTLPRLQDCTYLKGIALTRVLPWGLMEFAEKESCSDSM